MIALATRFDNPGVILVILVAFASGYILGKVFR